MTISKIEEFLKVITAGIIIAGGFSSSFTFKQNSFVLADKAGFTNKLKTNKCPM